MNGNINAERPCTIAESIKQSCQEVKLMRNGVVPKRSWKELKHQLISRNSFKRG
jgi:hypothetical protein